MNNPSNGLPPLSRRNFMKATTLTGMALWGAAPIISSFEQEGGAGGANGGAGPVPLAPPDKQPPNLDVPQPGGRKIGWAIVGLGELALGEIMPAFSQCEHSKVVSLVSGHPEKAQKVAKEYGVDEKAIYNYENYDTIADNPEIEAVYIVLPNSMHAEFTIRALKAGKHVLCEKPLAPTLAECEQMIAAAKAANRKLMTAYRLHYEPMNLKVMEMCEQQKYGKIKVFSSSNCMNVQAPNIRLSSKLGGGPVGDVGIYSINAARYVTREEPTEVFAFAHQPADDPRFREVPQTVSYTLKFPSGALADCVCSFGTARDDRFRVLCEDGYINMDPAFSYRGLKLSVSTNEGSTGERELAQLKIREVDQFAKEMDHFSDCIINNKQPDTPGEEGLADMKVVVAIDESIKTGKPVKIG